MVVYIGNYTFGLFPSEAAFPEKSVLLSDTFTCTCSVLWKSYVILGISAENSEMSLSSEKSNLNHSFAEINMITISPEIIKSSTFLLKETLQI